MTETYHPRRGKKGERVLIAKPNHASAPDTWLSPDAVATFLPDGETPPSLNGVPMTRWRDAPLTNPGWATIAGMNDGLDEPPFNPPAGKKASSGIVIEEPDGRVWVIHPTNAFGGYKASFPKGTAEQGLSLQANAIKETYEETGLQVEITGFLGDYTRTTSVARIYTARRTGGSPASAGWETQAVSLVPKHKLFEFLNMTSDHGIAEHIGAGHPPGHKKQ